MQIDHDEDTLMIHDKYPKGHQHALVIPRLPGLLDLSCLRREHLPLLKHMRQRGQAWAAAQSASVNSEVRICVHTSEPVECPPEHAQLTEAHLIM